MSVIVRAQMKKLSVNTKFEDEECLLNALKEKNVEFSVNNGQIVINRPQSIKFVKKGTSYVVEYEALTEIVDRGIRASRWGIIGNETEKGKRMVDSRTREVYRFIDDIEDIYDRFLNEKIEKLKLEQYEKESLREIQNEEEERKTRIMREREIKRLERIKRKREKERRKMVEEKTEKLKERAKMLGYEIEEQVVNDERILVLVRRR